MPLLDRLGVVEQTQRDLVDRVSRHEEQINGNRGIQAAIDENTAEIKSLKRAAWWVGGLIIAGSITFAFSALALMGNL